MCKILLSVISLFFTANVALAFDADVDIHYTIYGVPQSGTLFYCLDNSCKTATTNASGNANIRCYENQPVNLRWMVAATEYLCPNMACDFGLINVINNGPGGIGCQQTFKAVSSIK